MKVVKPLPPELVIALETVAKPMGLTWIRSVGLARNTWRRWLLGLGLGREWLPEGLGVGRLVLLSPLGEVGLQVS